MYHKGMTRVADVALSTSCVLTKYVPAGKSMICALRYNIQMTAQHTLNVETA